MLYLERDENKRKEFIEQIKNIPVQDIIWLDESGVNHQEVKETAWLPKGSIKIGEKAGKRRGRTTIIAALNIMNEINNKKQNKKNKIIAPFYFKGHTNTSVFLTWLNEYLLPRVKSNQVIVMDNAAFHKSEKIKELIKSKNCKLLFLPPYSPDLNPIEKYWAFIKRHLKKLWEPDCNFLKNLDKVFEMEYCMQ